MKLVSKDMEKGFKLEQKVMSMREKITRLQKDIP